MAHSKIIQLEKEPISETVETSASSIAFRDYDRCFLASVADWVDDDDYHEKTVKDFIENLHSVGSYIDIGCEGEEQWIMFHEGFIQAYFARIYPEFEKKLQELVSNANLDALCGYEMETLLYALDRIVDDRFGIYIDSKEHGLRPMNTFIREIEPNIRYYIGGTVDYHY